MSQERYHKSHAKRRVSRIASPTIQTGYRDIHYKTYTNTEDAQENERQSQRAYRAFLRFFFRLSLSALPTSPTGSAGLFSDVTAILSRQRRKSSVADIHSCDPAPPPVPHHQNTNITIKNPFGPAFFNASQCPDVLSSLPLSSLVSRSLIYTARGIVASPILYDGCILCHHAITSAPYLFIPSKSGTRSKCLALPSHHLTCEGRPFVGNFAFISWRPKFNDVSSSSQSVVDSLHSSPRFSSKLPLDANDRLASKNQSGAFLFVSGEGGE